MTRRSSAAKTLVPQPLFKTFRLLVVMYEGAKMFFDPITKRAMSELYAGHLPYQSTIELRRNGECVARATATIVGSRDLSSAFEGTAPLVVRDAWLEQEAGRDYQRAGSFGSTISVRRAGIRIGDELIIMLPRKQTLNCEPRLGVNQWFVNMTLPTQDAVVDARRGDRAWKQIEKMMPNEKIAADFWFRHNEKPWREALRIAKRYVARLSSRSR